MEDLLPLHCHFKLENVHLRQCQIIPSRFGQVPLNMKIQHEIATIIFTITSLTKWLEVITFLSIVSTQYIWSLERRCRRAFMWPSYQFTYGHNMKGSCFVHHLQAGTTARFIFAFKRTKRIWSIPNRRIWRMKCPTIWQKASYHKKYAKLPQHWN